MRARTEAAGFFRNYPLMQVLAFVGPGATLLLLLASSAGSGRQAAQPAAQIGNPSSDRDTALLEGFRHVEVASVSDALEQLTGKKMYMTHRMRPIFTTRFAGRALTVLLKKE